MRTEFAGFALVSIFPSFALAASVDWNMPKSSVSGPIVNDGTIRTVTNTDGIPTFTFFNLEAEALQSLRISPQSLLDCQHFKRAIAGDRHLEVVEASWQEEYAKLIYSTTQSISSASCALYILKQ